MDRGQIQTVRLVRTGYSIYAAGEVGCPVQLVDLGQVKLGRQTVLYCISIPFCFLIYCQHLYLLRGEVIQQDHGKRTGIEQPSTNAPV